MNRFGLVLVAVVASLAAACSSTEPVEFAGYQRIPVPVVGEGSVPEAGAGDFSFAADDGHVLLVYFGYTACPDVCPTTLSDVRSALKKVDDPDKIDLAMITVDPERDTGDILTGYVQSFVAGSHALRSEDDSVVRAAADLFGADYSVATAEDGDPEVAHTGSLYAVNSDGELALTWPFGTTSDDIASDLALLLDGAS